MKNKLDKLETKLNEFKVDIRDIHDKISHLKYKNVVFDSELSNLQKLNLKVGIIQNVINGNVINKS
jgi:hypothetical protein